MLAFGSVSPRKLLTLCAERFELRLNRAASNPPASADRQAATAPAGAETAARFLEDNWKARTFEQKLKANSPERTEDIVRHGLPMLVELVAPTAKIVRDERLPDVPLIFEQAGGRCGLGICTQANMTSRAALLKRLKQQFALKRLARLAVVCDDRVPFTENARAARQYLVDLEQQQAVAVFPSVKALAALDALRELLSDAKSGDLACQGEAVSPVTVREWLKKHLPGVLLDLVDEVFGTESNDVNRDQSDMPASRVV